MKQLFIAFLALSFPALVFGAGFGKEALFLSKNSVTEGDTVLIHTIVSNEASTKFTGTLKLTSGDATIGTVPVTLPGGEAQVVSVSWKPQSGSHTIEALLTTTEGEEAEKTSATFNIKEKPKADGETGSTTVQSSEDLQNQLASISPGVAEFAKPVFNTIDSLRTSAVGALDNGINWAKGKVAGQATESDEDEPKGLMGTAWTILATILLNIFSILKYLISNPALFYPIFAILFIYSLWRLYKRMTRPKYPDFG